MLYVRTLWQYSFIKINKIWQGKHFNYGQMWSNPFLIMFDYVDDSCLFHLEQIPLSQLCLHVLGVNLELPVQ